MEYEVYDAADALFEERYCPEADFDPNEGFGYNLAVNRELTEEEHEEMLMLQDWMIELQAKGERLPEADDYRLNHLEDLALASGCGCEACYETRKQAEFDADVSKFGFSA